MNRIFAYISIIFVVIFIFLGIQAHEIYLLKKEIVELKRADDNIVQASMDGIKGALQALEIDKTNSANIAALMEIIRYADWDSYETYYNHYLKKLTKPNIKGWAGVYSLDTNGELNLKTY